MNTDYLVFVSLFFLGLTIRAVYEQFKMRGRIDPKKKIIFTTVFSAMCLLWVSWFSMCPLDPFKLSLPGVARWLGLGAFLVGLGLAMGALIQLKGVENIDQLKTTGLFSKIRHPMYMGFILWVFGWAIFHGAVISLIVGGVAVWNILKWKRLEEKELKKTYGDVYSAYYEKTWF